MTITPTQYSAPDPYVGFDGPHQAAAPSSGGASRQQVSPTATTQSGVPLWGTPTGTDPAAAAKAAAIATAKVSAPPSQPASRSVPPAVPTASQPASRSVPAAVPTATRTGRRSSSAPSRGPAWGTWAFAVLGIGAVLVLAGLVAGTAVRVLGGSDGGGRPGGPELEVLWRLDSADLTDGWARFESVDGSLPGAVLSTSAGWVAMVEPSTVDAVLVSVDPDTGETRWAIDMPEGRCTQTELGVDLVCLTRDSSTSPFQVVTIDVETGEVADDPAITTLTHVPVLLLGLADGLLTLSATGDLAALDLDGTVRWSGPLELDDLDMSYLQVDVKRYETATLLYLGWNVGAVHATPDGFTTHDCHKVAATAEAWVCMDVDGGEATGRTPEGETLWAAEWSDYYLVDKYQRIAPVVIADNWDGTVSPVDPMTGLHGDPVEVGTREDNLSFLGDAEHPVVTTDDAVALLDADITTVLWQTSITDEYLGIADGGLVGDAIIVDAESSYGFDVSSGDLLWERGYVPYDGWVLDGAFITVGSTYLTRFDV